MQTIHEAIEKGTLSQIIAQHCVAVFAKCEAWFSPAPGSYEDQCCRAMLDLGVLEAKNRRFTHHGYKYDFKQSTAAAGAA